MTASPFDLINFGYFAYVANQDTCSHIVVPRIALVPHVCLLGVSRAATTIDGTLKVQTVNQQYLGIDVEGLSISMDTEKPAKLGHRPPGSSIDMPDFDWVPKFTETCCGVALNPKWRSTPAIHSVLTLGGGKLRAEKDGNTCKKIWSWRLCDGSLHEQRVTSKTTYSIGSVGSIALNFHSLSTNAAVARATIDFDSQSPPYFLNAPLDPKTAVALVEFAHVHAMLGLCVPAGGEIRVPPKTPTGNPCAPQNETPAPTSHLGPLSNPITLHDGTPECSGQQFPPP
jgi:hypothetical protein